MSLLQKGQILSQRRGGAEIFRREIRFYQRLSVAQKAFCTGLNYPQITQIFTDFLCENLRNLW